MATVENQVAGYNANDFLYISQGEYEGFVENKLEIEQIKAISEKRQKEAKYFLDNFDEKRFPLLEEKECRKLVQEGNSLSKIDTINKEREKAPKKFSLKVNQKDFMSNTNLGICIMGLSGAGKSATGNLILGEDQDVFSQQPGTLFERNINGFDVSVVEMPASDQSIDDSTWEETLKKFPKLVNVFLFVVNISNHRDIARQKQIWDEMKIHYGNKCVAHCILVLTHAETTLLDQAPDLDTLYSLYTNDPTDHPFGQVLQELYPRIIALDNKTQDYHNRRNQQEIVLKMVKEVSDYNRDPYKLYKGKERSNISSLPKDTGMVEGSLETTQESIE